MLLKITEKCRMNCDHCMDGAVENCDRMMDKQTFIDSIKFIEKCYMPCMPMIVMSGGEPTENENWLEYLEMIPDISMVPWALTLVSNGMNMTNEYIERLTGIHDKFKYKNGLFQIQISTGKWYKTKINTDLEVFKLPFVVVDTYMDNAPIYPQGRARENNIPWSSKASRCFNVRSIIRQQKDFRKSIAILSMINKICTPQISYDGHIRLGESNLCPSVASIYDTEEEIVEKICNFKCKGCDIINKRLPVTYLQAIGEL